MRFVKMKVSQYNTVSYGKNSIRYQGAKLYNDLNLATQFTCLSDFKQFIKDWKPECACVFNHVACFYYMILKNVF